jgi:hypothetical protein
MAETVGVEPTEAVNLSDLANRRTRPLCEVSLVTPVQESNLIASLAGVLSITPSLCHGGTYGIRTRELLRDRQVP